METYGHRRLATSSKSPPKGQQPAASIHIQKNDGIAAHSVNIGTVNFKRERQSSRRTPTPGLIEADPDMRTYADYLVKKYIDWRKKGVRIDKRKFSPGSAHGILGEGFGSPSSVMLISQGRFFDWVVQAQAKIDRTTWGRINRHRNYHTWEEHIAQRRG